MSRAAPSANSGLAASSFLDGLATVFTDLLAERGGQDDMFGNQDHLPDGTGPRWQPQAQAARRECDSAANTGRLALRHTLAEEFAEATAEDDPTRLRAELVQVAAVATQWIQAIDCRHRRHAWGGNRKWPSRPNS